jgi:hypothetical protein
LYLVGKWYAEREKNNWYEVVRKDRETISFISKRISIENESYLEL